jgi:hypothetical protein
MIQPPILDQDYWAALEILTEEVGSIKECAAQRLPWYPADGDRFDWAFRTYRNWHPEGANNPTARLSLSPSS